MIPFGLSSLMTVSLPIGRRATKCLVPGASMILLCNEGSGTTVLDYSGNDNEGTLGPAAAAPTWTAEGLTFGGDGDYVDIGILAALASGNPYTIQVVAKFDDTTTTESHIIGQMNAVTGIGKAGCYLTKRNTDGKLQFLQFDSDANHTLRGCTSVSAITPGQYYAITGVFDGATMRLYIGDAPTASVATGFTPDPAHYTRFGKRPYSSTGGYFAGGLAFAAVYPFALTAAQVAQNVAYIRAAIAPPRGIAVHVPPTVLFTFDDVAENIYQNAFPILAAAGLKGTVYVISSYVGNEGYVSLAQAQALYAAGWDVGNHTSGHQHLATFTEAEQETRIANCSAYLVANGMPRAAYHLAYPFGEYNADTLTAMAAVNMLTGRTTAGTAEIVPITAPYEIDGVIGIGSGTVVGDVKQQIEMAPAGSVIPFVCHHVTDAPAAGIPLADFAAIADYTKAKGCRVVTISQLWDYMQAGYVWP